MEILFGDKYYDTDKWAPGKFQKETQKEIENIGIRGNIYDENIQQGADWPVVLAELFYDIDWGPFSKITLFGLIFLSGKKINENLEAWAHIWDKIKTLFNRIQPSRIDEKTAFIFGIDYLKSQYNIDRFLDSTIQICVYNTNPNYDKSILHRPDALYLMKIVTPEHIHILGVKSNKKIVIEKKIKKAWYAFIDEEREG